MLKDFLEKNGNVYFLPPPRRSYLKKSAAYPGNNCRPKFLYIVHSCYVARKDSRKLWQAHTIYGHRIAKTQVYTDVNSQLLRT
jgi:hypothetical protein